MIGLGWVYGPTPLLNGKKIFGLINVWPKENKKERDNIRVVFSHMHSCLFIFHGRCRYRCLFVFAWAPLHTKETLHGKWSKEEQELVCISSSSHSKINQVRVFSNRVMQPHPFWSETQIHDSG